MANRSARFQVKGIIFLGEKERRREPGGTLADAPELIAVDLLELPRLIPQRQFHPIPEAQFVIDQAQVVLHNMLGRP
jgi:hypothetical protein